jgi:hypothetical protein
LLTGWLFACRSIWGPLTSQTCRDYIEPWDLLDKFALIQFDEEQNSASWKWTSGGVYIAASAYLPQFVGPLCTTNLENKGIPKCRLHAWPLMHNKCLTADNLVKKGWPHFKANAGPCIVVCLPLPVSPFKLGRP